MKVKRKTKTTTTLTLNEKEFEALVKLTGNMTEFDKIDIGLTKDQSDIIEKMFYKLG